MHRKECFSGGLFTNPDWSVAIDANDNAVLYLFWPKFFDDGAMPARLPPEYRTTPCRSQSIQATAATDLYHLGLLLWRIAGRHQRMSLAHFCEIAKCTRSSEVESVEQHANPVQLPIISADIPDISATIISRCRAERPGERLPASELVRLMEWAVQHYDPDSNITDRQSQAIPPQRMEDCIAKFGLLTMCDQCLRITNTRKFHCGICNLSDYDLCETCFLTKGLHCHEQSHYMREFLGEIHYSKDAGESRKWGRWYSNVKENGEREVIID